MKRIIFALMLVTLVVAGCVRAPRLTRLEVPDEVPVVPMPTVDVGAYAEKYAAYDGVYLNIEQTIEHSGSKNQSLGAFLLGGRGADWHYSNVYKREYLILNPEADWLTTFSIGFKPDKMYMRLVYPDGTVRMFGNADLQEYKDSDGDKNYKIAFPNVKKGTVVTIGYEYSYAVSYFLPPLEHDIPLQFAVPCEKLTFTFGYPNWWTVQIKEIAPNQSVPVQYRQEEAARKTMMVYQATDIPSLQYEPYAPPYKQVAKYLNFRVTSLLMEDIKPDLIDSWDEMAERFRKYAIKKSKKESDLVVRTVDSLIKGKNSRREKLEEVVDFVSSQIAWYPEGNDGDAGKTLKLKRGSIYDITGLTKSMLFEAGIDANYLLVHNAYDGYFDDRFISMDQFSVPALLAQLDSRQQIIFPAYEHLPVGLIPQSYQDQTAIVVSDVGTAVHWKVPIDSSKSNAIKSDFHITLDSSGLVSVKQHRSYHGIYAYNVRTDMAGSDRNGIIDSLKSALTFPGADLTVNSVVVANDSLYREPLLIDYDYTVRNLVMITPGEMVLQSAELMASLAEFDLSTDTTARQNPIWIGATGTIEQIVTIVPPVGWVPAELPESTSVENGFGTLTCNAVVVPEGIRITQLVTLKRSLQPREKYGELLELVGRNAKSTISAVVFKPA